MDYPIKTLSQLHLLVKSYRKAAGLTQGALAERLGITQQSYAQFEANPAAASVERLFTVLRLLEVDMTLSHSVSPAITPKVAGHHRTDKKGMAVRGPASTVTRASAARGVTLSKATPITTPALADATPSQKENW